MFHSELCSLSKGSGVKSNSSLAWLNQFLNTDRLIRINTCIDVTHIPWEHSHPTILASTHKVPRTLITYYHEKYFNLANQTLLYHLRLKYWQIKGLRTIKTSIISCISFLKQKSNFYLQQIAVPCDAPPEGLIPSRPYTTYMGLDYFGLLKVSRSRYVVTDDDTNIVYVLLLICLVTRALHLELVNDQSLDNFLCALRKFVARHGTPIISVFIVWGTCNLLLRCNRSLL